MFFKLLFFYRQSRKLLYTLENLCWNFGSIWYSRFRKILQDVLDFGLNPRADYVRRLRAGHLPAMRDGALSFWWSLPLHCRSGRFSMRAFWQRHDLKPPRPQVNQQGMHWSLRANDLPSRRRRPVQRNCFCAETFDDPFKSPHWCCVFIRHATARQGPG